MATNYFAVFFPVREGGYSVEFPDLPEAFTQGKTLDECLTLGAEVLAITIEEYAKARKALPAPVEFDDVWRWASEQRSDADFLPERDPIIQLFRAPDVDMTPVRVTISLAKSTLEEIDEKAKQAGYTRSGFLAKAAQEYKA